MTPTAATAHDPAVRLAAILDLAFGTNGEDDAPMDEERRQAIERLARGDMGAPEGGQDAADTDFDLGAATDAGGEQDGEDSDFELSGLDGNSPDAPGEADGAADPSGNRELADDLAGLLNDMQAAGDPVTEDELREIDGDLSGTGYGVEQDERGAWHVVPLQHRRSGYALQFLRDDDDLLQYAAMRAPSGYGEKTGRGLFMGKYRGGQFIPKQDMEGIKAKAAAGDETAKAGLAELEKTAAGHEANRQKRTEERRKRDVSKLAEKLEPHRQAHDQPLDAQQLKSARLSWNALKRIHGDLAVHRLDELTDMAVGRLERLKDNKVGATETRARLRSFLAKYHAMHEMARAGEAATAPERTPVAPKHPPAPTKPALTPEKVSPPATKPPTSKPIAGDATTQEASRLILKQMPSAPVHSVAELRDQMPPGLQGQAFNDAVLRLADEGKIALAQDASPHQFTDEQKKKLIQDGDNLITAIMPLESEESLAEASAPSAEPAPATTPPAASPPPRQQLSSPTSLSSISKSLNEWRARHGGGNKDTPTAEAQPSAEKPTAPEATALATPAPSPRSDPRALLAQKPMTKGDLMQSLGIGGKEAQTILDEMKAKGELEAAGETPGGMSYRLKAPAKAKATKPARKPPAGAMTPADLASWRNTHLGRRLAQQTGEAPQESPASPPEESGASRLAATIAGKQAPGENKSQGPPDWQRVSPELRQRVEQAMSEEPGETKGRGRPAKDAFLADAALVARLRKTADSDPEMAGTLRKRADDLERELLRDKQVRRHERPDDPLTLSRWRAECVLQFADMAEAARGRGETDVSLHYARQAAEIGAG